MPQGNQLFELIDIDLLTYDWFTWEFADQFMVENVQFNII